MAKYLHCIEQFGKRKKPQAHNGKYKKCSINHVINNAHNIFDTRSFKFGYYLADNRLDLDS